MKSIQEIMIESMKPQLDEITIIFTDCEKGIINATMVDSVDKTKPCVAHDIKINMGKPYTFYEIITSFLQLGQQGQKA